MKLCMIFITLLLWLSFVNAAPEQQNEKLYTDKEVEKIARKLSKAGIFSEGSLDSLSKKNGLRLLRHEFSSVQEIITLVGFDRKRITRIEGIGANGWNVDRYHVSPSYDLFIEVLVKDFNKEGSIRIHSVFLAPHKKETYALKLNTRKLWSKIIFEQAKKRKERKDEKE